MNNNKVISCSIKRMLPDGIYSGFWSGYSVKILHDCEEWSVQTSSGIRGIVPASVAVKDGVATVARLDMSDFEKSLEKTKSYSLKISDH